MNQEVKVILAIVGVSLLLLVGGAVLFSKSGQGSEEDGRRADVSRLIKDDSYAIATSSAQVTLVEFSDFQCPACASAHPTIKRLLSEYYEELAFVYRHFPLTQTHANAEAAAEAAEAAGEQGQFWAMHDTLFENQADWAEEKNPREKFVSYAVNLGLDVDTFMAALESGKFKEKIKRDQADGLALGVNSTPTFFINGRKVGSLNYLQLKDVIDSELGKN